MEYTHIYALQNALSSGPTQLHTWFRHRPSNSLEWANSQPGALRPLFVPCVDLQVSGKLNRLKNHEMDSRVKFGNVLLFSPSISHVRRK